MSDILLQFKWTFETHSAHSFVFSSIANIFLAFEMGSQTESYILGWRCCIVVPREFLSANLALCQAKISSGQSHLSYHVKFKSPHRSKIEIPATYNFDTIWGKFCVLDHFCVHLWRSVSICRRFEISPPWSWQDLWKCAIFLIIKTSR